MAIVAGILLSDSVWLFGRRRPTYFLGTLGALWGYAMLVGMSPSVMRAAPPGRFHHHIPLPYVSSPQRSSAALVDSLDDTDTITSDQGVTHSLAIIIDN